MTYSRTHRPADRVATLVAVGAIQVAAFYALVAGLSVVFEPVSNPPPISATNSPLPVPPPPEQHRRSRHDDPVVKPLPQPVPSPLPTALASPQPQPTEAVVRDPQPTGGSDATNATARPTPTAVPRAARPLGRPGDWVSEADYPTSDIRLGHAGVVGFSLTISPAGRVTGCEIVRSSGFASLDALTCTLLTRRARFQPASDEQGQPVNGRYQSAVRWQIPD